MHPLNEVQTRGMALSTGLAALGAGFAAGFAVGVLSAGAYSTPGGAWRRAGGSWASGDSCG